MWKKKTNLQMSPGCSLKLMWFMWFAVIWESDCVLLLPQLLSQICSRLLHVTNVMVSFLKNTFLVL